MDKILDMIAKWEPFGQGIFFIIVVCCLLTTINYAVKMLVVLFRGWPLCECQTEDSEE